MNFVEKRPKPAKDKIKEDNEQLDKYLHKYLDKKN